MPADRSSRLKAVRTPPAGPLKRGETEAEALAAIKAEYDAEEKEMERRRLKAVEDLSPTADRRIKDPLEMGSNLNSRDMTLGKSAPTAPLPPAPKWQPQPLRAGAKKTAGRRRRSSSLSAMIGKPLKMLMGKKTRKNRRNTRRR
jgi:hypothetical protein